MIVFGKAFNEIETYEGKMPSQEYWEHLLSQEHFIALVALAPDPAHAPASDPDVVCGLAARH